MKINDLGAPLQLRYLVTDDKGKAHAVFADEKKAQAYVIHVRQTKRKLGL